MRGQRRLRAGAAFAWLCIAAACVAHDPRPKLELVVDGRFTMGTALELTLVSGDPAGARARLVAEFAEVAELDALMSRHAPDSALSRLNLAAGGPARKVDPRLREILRLAIELAALTQGRFDVTVGPLVALWTRAAELDRLPSSGEVLAARERVGAERIRFEEDGRVALPERGMAIDLGGIAKGFALDAMADRLRRGGQNDALLSFGQSSVWALGTPPDGPGWRLLLPPTEGGEGIVLELSDLALSVSSSLGQSTEIEGRRFGHVIDPRSGLPVSELRRVAVVGPNAAAAEALSTALVILDPEQGISLIEAQVGFEARLDNQSGEIARSSGWRRATRSRAMDSGTFGVGEGTGYGHAADGVASLVHTWSGLGGARGNGPRVRSAGPHLDGGALLARGHRNSHSR